MQALAKQAGAPDFREFVVPSHLILYARGKTRIVALSIRRQRELGYFPDL